MLNFYRKFFIVTFLSLVIVFIVLTMTYRYVMRHQAVESAKHDSAVFMRFIEETVKQNPDLMNKLTKANNQDFRKSSEYIQLDKLIRLESRDIRLLQFNLYDENGHVVYSTVPSQLDTKISVLPSFRYAIQGKAKSQLVQLKHLYNLQGVANDYEAVSVFVPVSWAASNQVDAVAQLYIDMSGYSFSINKASNIEYLSTALILLLLYFVLHQFIKRSYKYAQSSENKIAELQDELKLLVYRDKLTELPNRTQFIERLEQSMQKVDQSNMLLAVLSLDLNRFKYVNDKYGFEVGDKLLISVAERLKRCIRDRDFIARLHGGNFAVILKNLPVVDDASELANQIREVLSESFEIDGREIFITFCIGLAVYPFDDDDPETLLLKADSALLYAKEAGRNTYRMYDSESRNIAIRRFSLENDLRHAIERKEFLIHYQPIVQITSGEIIGVEALLRWNCPKRGLVPPLEFITVLEDSGMIIKIGEWILKTACMQGKRWFDEGYGNLKININISARQFNDIDLLPVVEEALNQSGLPPYLLNLEITESLLLENRGQVLVMLDRLIEKGVSMSVDDFGTGYSSMAYLKNMPIETIKIDKSFVQGLPDDMDDIAIIHAIDYLSKSLRLNVIAEGVETPRQLAFLSKLNVRAIQGYLVSRPLPAAELENVMRQHDPKQYSYHSAISASSAVN